MNTLSYADRFKWEVANVIFTLGNPNSFTLEEITKYPTPRDRIKYGIALKRLGYKKSGKRYFVPEIDTSWLR